MYLYSLVNERFDLTCRVGLHKVNTGVLEIALQIRLEVLGILYSKKGVEQATLLCHLASERGLHLPPYCNT